MTENIDIGIEIDIDENFNEKNNSHKKPHEGIDKDDITIEDEGKYKPKDEKENIEPNKLKELSEQINDNKALENNNNNPPEADTTDPNIKVINEKWKVPSNLLKTFIVTIILAVIGLVLIILGCIQSIAEHTPGKGIMFWVLGSIVIIPGGFYSFQFYKAVKAKDEYEKEKIFDQIPEL